MRRPNSLKLRKPRAMLDKLTALCPGTLAQLRHLRVLGETLMLSYPEDAVYHRLVSSLRLLTGLCLDTLTVLGMRLPILSYETSDGLIGDSFGWKELRYISHTSEMLGFSKPRGFPFADEAERRRHWRRPQPALSKPSVTISARPYQTVTAQSSTPTRARRLSRRHLETKNPETSLAS
ncbi:hypothetical protein B0T10DRAFT_492155 [Thelonectria olida]|uniref:Uncharacterized protein n=1 Tax=Thelonectria olida TaxID=1576542 RepID=A0A9P8VYI2_9HYPO|nr:hypothetical protein B0T10DRAFT_492155 [Thelonectria olida]